MPPSNRHGARVIYVASSARELPGEVQDWLSRAENPAAASPTIHDALALLAMGRKPAAIIVSMDAVDFSELDFFDHAARLSGETRIYVAGHDYHESKIEAACARGARVFDADVLDDDLEAVSARKEAIGPEDLLAGSLRPAQPEPTGISDPSIRGEEMITAEKPAEESQPPEPPAVRLLTDRDLDEESTDDTPIPVPVPWAPSPNRPKRTPPKAAAPKDEAPAIPRAAPADTDPAPPRPSPVELTPEELAALLGKSSPPGTGPAKEQRQ